MRQTRTGCSPFLKTGFVPKRAVQKVFLESECSIYSASGERCLRIFRDLPRTLPIEFSENRHNLRAELVFFRIDVRKSIHQRDICDTERFF